MGHFWFWKVWHTGQHNGLGLFEWSVRWVWLWGILAGSLLTPKDKEEYKDRVRGDVLREWYSFFSGGQQGLTFSTFMDKVQLTHFFPDPQMGEGKVELGKKTPPESPNDKRKRHVKHRFTEKEGLASEHKLSGSFWHPTTWTILGLFSHNNEKRRSWGSSGKRHSELSIDSSLPPRMCLFYFCWWQ